MVKYMNVQRCGKTQKDPQKSKKTLRKAKSLVEKQKKAYL